jgi:carboxymethylenebutenolidase
MMKRLLLIATVVFGLAGLCRAGEETVSYKSGDESVSSFLVTPAGPGPHPALVVIQEWWGLNDWVKDQARALGKEGYVALAVDLYRGKVATTQEDAHQLMMGARLTASSAT